MKYIVDIDGTICTASGPVISREPYKNRIKKINALYDSGHEIVYQTARGQTSGRGEDYYRPITEAQLELWGCKYHKLLFEKENADFYIDDRGINDVTFFKNHSDIYVDEDLVLILPMAGKASRFKAAGIDTPKPLIPVNGKPMLKLMAEKLKIHPKEVIFVTVPREIYDPSNFNPILNDPDGLSVDETAEIQNILSDTFPKSRILPVHFQKRPSGAALTILKTIQEYCKFTEDDKRVLIANCDQYMNWFPEKVLTYFSKFDGGLVTFKADDPSFSYAKVDSAGYLERVAEKDPISEHATAGYYFWSSMKELEVDILSFISDDSNKVNNEFYLAPVYNEGIKRGMTYVIAETPWVAEVGTPEFLENYNKSMGYE